MPEPLKKIRPSLFDFLDETPILATAHDAVDLLIPSNRQAEFTAALDAMEFPLKPDQVHVLDSVPVNYDYGEIELRVLASQLPDEHPEGSAGYKKPGPVVNKRKREGVQLCQIYNPARPPKWELACFEPKRNGYRCRAEIRDGKATLLTSSGLPHWNVDHIIFELEKGAACFKTCDNIMLDGELMHESLEFNVAGGILRNHKEDSRASGFWFHVWDALPLADFDKRECSIRLRERKTFMEEILRNLHEVVLFCQVKANPYHFGYVSEALKYAKDFVIGMGEEGLVMKDANSLYTPSVDGSKAPSWLKWKPKFLEDGLIQNMYDADMRVEGAVEGRGKHKGMLGALKVSGYLCDDGNIGPHRDPNSELGGRYISTEVGTGPTNPQRRELWKWHLEGSLEGRVVELKYESITTKGSLQHPVFFRMREDKD